MQEWQEFECIHIKRQSWKPSTLVTHETLPDGAASHLDPLHTKTKLCPICSGMVIALLKQLEEQGP